MKIPDSFIKRTVPQLAAALFVAMAAVFLIGRANALFEAQITAAPDSALLEEISLKDPDRVDEIIARRKTDAALAVKRIKAKRELEKRAEKEEAERLAEKEKNKKETQKKHSSANGGNSASKAEEAARRAEEQKQAEASLSADERDRISIIEDTSINPWSCFKNSVIMGDSRAVGFWYYHFLDKSRVLADGGNNIRKILPEIEKLKSLNPDTLFLCYGLNDVGIGIWKTPEAYAAEYMQIIDRLKEALPNTRIVVSSILPASENAIKTKGPSWAKIPAYSEAVGAQCAAHGAIYADNSAVVNRHFDLWDSDGVHLRKSFYPYWARSLVTSYLREGLR